VNLFAGKSMARKGTNKKVNFSGKQTSLLFRNEVYLHFFIGFEMIKTWLFARKKQSYKN
jgi:hypothetical protein